MFHLMVLLNLYSCSLDLRTCQDGKALQDKVDFSMYLLADCLLIKSDITFPAEGYLSSNCNV